MIEVTRKYARAYVAATKKVKGAMLDEFCIVTGLSRDRARHLLTATGTRPSNVARIDRRRAKPRKYSTDATRVLERVWVLSGCECGPYLAADMTRLLLNLEANGELAAGKGGYSPGVRAELEAMSGATIDRYLAGFKATHGLRGFTTTRPGPLLRTSIQIRKAGDEAEAEPGFLEVDTVAHCGPTLKGEFARSVSLTDVVTGWTQVIAIRNNARRLRPSTRPSTCSRSRSKASTATTAPSSSTTTSSTGPATATSSSPDHGPTGRTTRPPSKPRTTTSCAGEGSTTATTPPPSSRS